VTPTEQVQVHGRLSSTGPLANRITVDILRLEDGLITEHRDVVGEATAEESKSRLPMFGDTFPTRA
jgi:predicted SnoaL-like aldol condensation-catalyzing enzyme